MDDEVHRASGRRARTDLCGGRSAMVVPTATVVSSPIGVGTDKRASSDREIPKHPSRSFCTGTRPRRTYGGILFRVRRGRVQRSYGESHTANPDSWLLAQNLVSVLRGTGSADSAEHSRS